MRSLPLLLVCLLLGCGPAPSATSTKQASKPKAIKQDASDLFFSGPIRQLELKVKDKEIEKIGRENRPYASCTLIEKDASGNVLAEYKEVAIKLKGAAGSFQSFDAKPALTVRPDKTIAGQLFHGLARFHLNNSVQDETYLQEQICSELFLEAGVPATRVTHARVWLNERDMGLYVLKEGFDTKFLARHFTKPDGNLYDGGFCADIDSDLEKDSGADPDDRHDLIALREACQIATPEERWKRLDELVDIDNFLRFVALELMTNHWDGYSQNRNNYRLYFDPATNKARFFPHGMDQMFGDPHASIVDMPSAMVAHAVLENPTWRADFKQKVKELLPMFSPPERLIARVDALTERLELAVNSLGEEASRHHADRVRELKERLATRAQSLEEQKSFPAPVPEEFDEQGVLALEGWLPASEVEDALLEEVAEEGKPTLFKIASGPSGRCVASWRKRLLLPPAKYRFVARAQSQDVVPLENDDRGPGAGLRISGSIREQGLMQSSDWTDLQFEFVVEGEPRDIELIAELRGNSGAVQFQQDSLRLQRVP